METSQKIRILIVDDHSMVRKGLMTFLKNRPDLEVVGEARDGQEAADLCARLQPDVILMDLVCRCAVWPPRLIRRRCPEAQVIPTSFGKRSSSGRTAGRGDWLHLEERLRRRAGGGHSPGHAGRPTLYWKRSSAGSNHAAGQPRADPPRLECWRYW
jgi:hypothetical protein